MKIKKVPLPKHSCLNTSQRYDYVDSFQGIIYDKHDIFTSVDVAKAFFTSGPEWVGQLFNLRNKIVAKFGLKIPDGTNDPQKQLKNFRCEPGERIGLFKVFASHENEVILGEDDKHLNFRISLFLEKFSHKNSKKNLTVSTTVVFNNWLGRVYFLPVRPFHSVIVPTILKGIIKDLEKRNEDFVVDKEKIGTAEVD